MFNRLLKIKSTGQSAFLFGPRGTGKTQWVKMAFPEALYIDLLNSREYTRLQSDPSRLEEMVLAHKDAWTIIDEVQKVPALLNEVHRLIEHHQCRFILTGSSSRKLKQSGTNLLAGRALTYHMHPLVATEIGESFNLTKALQYGLLPMSYLSEEPKHYLESYVATYLREEVLQEGLVRHLGTFSKFMEIASFSQGSQLNVLGISREVGVSRKIVESYFEILEDLLIAVQIPCFQKRTKRKLSLHPKFYYFDTGVFQAIRPRGPLDTPEEIGGFAFETLFLQHLRAIIDYQRYDLSIHFWRTSTGLEVDFVLYGENGLFAFKIKSRAYIERKDLKALKAFKADYPIAQCYLIYGGTISELHGEIKVLPIATALLQLSDILKKQEGPLSRQIHISDDFDDPLPPDIQAVFEGKK